MTPLRSWKISPLPESTGLKSPDLCSLQNTFLSPSLQAVVKGLSPWLRERSKMRSDCDINLQSSTMVSGTKNLQNCLLLFLPCHKARTSHHLIKTPFYKAVQVLTMKLQPWGQLSSWVSGIEFRYWSQLLSHSDGPWPGPWEKECLWDFTSSSLLQNKDTILSLILNNEDVVRHADMLEEVALETDSFSGSDLKEKKKKRERC